MAIQRCAVIGAGVMGSGIAAQIANAGVPVTLLDIVPPKANNRNVIAETAIEKMLKTDPAPFMSPRAARLVTPGNIEDDLTKLAECDWIVEAVLEKIEIKHATYDKIARRAQAGLDRVVQHLDDSAAGSDRGPARRFHARFPHHPFLQPAALYAAVGAGERTEDARRRGRRHRRILRRETRQACDPRKDTPGFIANRIGSMWIQAAIQAAFDLGLSVEEADAIMGRPFGMPRTGVFGLLDLVGTRSDAAGRGVDAAHLAGRAISISRR